MSYRVRVWDNYHYMDGSDAYDEGSYTTYDDALVAAKNIVRRSVEKSWQPGFTLPQLITQYIMYGEDPGIISDGPVTGPLFSARDYANELYEEVHRLKTLEYARGRAR